MGGGCHQQLFSHQAPQEDQGTESRSSGARGRDEGMRRVREQEERAEEAGDGRGGAGGERKQGGQGSGSAWARIAWSSTSRRKPWRSGSSSTWPSRPSLTTSSQGLDVGG
ncbi:unnamed protein product [Musa textilis]